MAKKKTKLKIVNKARFTVFCLVLMGLLSYGVSSAVNYASATNTPDTVLIFVQEGDTLWDIAREHSAGGRDIRRLVDEIKVYNGLENAVIRAGDKLEIPLI